MMRRQGRLMSKGPAFHKPGTMPGVLLNVHNNSIMSLMLFIHFTDKEAVRES